MSISWAALAIGNAAGQHHEQMEGIGTKCRHRGRSPLAFRPNAFRLVLPMPACRRICKYLVGAHGCTKELPSMHSITNGRIPPVSSTLIIVIRTVKIHLGPKHAWISASVPSFRLDEACSMPFCWPSPDAVWASRPLSILKKF